MSGQGALNGRPQTQTSAPVNSNVARAHTSYGTVARPSQSNPSVRNAAPQRIQATQAREHSLFQRAKRILLSNLPKLQAVRHPTTAPVKAPRPPKEWISVYLGYPFLIGLVAITLAIITSIVTLTVLSKYRSGFATVSTPSGRLAGFVWGKGLLWSSLPTLVFTLYKLGFDSVVWACADRQPFVELHEAGDRGARPERSALLNYRFVGIWKSWFVAIRNRHYLLGVCFILSLLLTLGLIPLAAYLFSTTSVDLDTMETVTQNTYFDAATGFTAEMSLAPVIDTVAATRLDGGNPPAWSNLNEAFQPFSLPAISHVLTNGFANFSAPTTAYAASLFCSTIPRAEYSVSLQQTGSEAGTLFFSAMDRGCPINTTLAISTGYKYYLQTFADVSCPFTANLSRVVIFGAMLQSQKLEWPTNFSAISCIPQYTRRPGTLEVTLGLTDNPFVRTFTPIWDADIDTARPGFWHVFESVLPQISNYDPTAETSYTEFGRLIIRLAQLRSPNSFLDASVLETATADIFASIWATLTATTLLKPSTTSTNITGTLQSSTVRLLVVPPVAYTILPILFLFFIVLVWVIRYVRTHHSILFAEPGSLVDHVGILCESDLYNDAVRLRRSVPEYNGNMRETMYREEGMLQDARFRMVDGHLPGRARIVTNYGGNFQREMQNRAVPGQRSRSL
jgi:hypothetical protein